MKSEDIPTLDMILAARRQIEEQTRLDLERARARDERPRGWFIACLRGVMLAQLVAGVVLVAINAAGMVGWARGLYVSGLLVLAFVLGADWYKRKVERGEG